MKLVSSYIFLENPYRKKEKVDNSSSSRTFVISHKKSIFDYIKSSQLSFSEIDINRDSFSTICTAQIQYSDYIYKVIFDITIVCDTTYLDVIVNGNNKDQIVRCMEYIQSEILNSGVRENYIDIISYDAVSEYYCNKMYPKLNTLERNLRRLLFNIYIVNFGRDYYRATIGEELQNKVKGTINRDSKKKEKEIKDEYKNDYNISTNTQIEEIERLQRFFYSLEYSDIQKLLFTPNWTNLDKAEKMEFLNNHSNLSELSDEKLREAFSQFVPKSDWERFFSNKINISNIKELIDKIRLYRNIVAHFKFFNKEEYDDCILDVDCLNSAIVEAIKITNDVDFYEKNAEMLSEIINVLSEILDSYRKKYEEDIKKALDAIRFPNINISDALKELTKNMWVKQFDNINKINKDMFNPLNPVVFKDKILNENVSPGLSLETKEDEDRKKEDE